MLFGAEYTAGCFAFAAYNCNKSFVSAQIDGGLVVSPDAGLVSTFISFINGCYEHCFHLIFIFCLLFLRLLFFASITCRGFTKSA